jgi:hypothetical protein
MTSDASTNAEIERLGAGHYVSLTTFRKDGTAVATPVWASTDGNALFVWTEANAGKIKRLRNSGRVLLAPCDARGRLQGAEVEGTARVLDDPAAIARVETLHKAKYKAQFGFFGLFAKVFRRGGGGHVGIEITVP